MNYIYIIFISITFVQYSYAQEYKKYISLDYPSLDSLMYLNYGEGSYKEAIALMQAGREKALTDFGKQDSTFASYTADLAFFYVKVGNYDKALLLYNQAIEIIDQTLGKNNIAFAGSLNNLASLHQKMGNYDKALPLYIQTMNILEKAFGQKSKYFLTALSNLAVFYQEMGNYDKALPLYIQIMETREKVLGKKHPHFINSLYNLASCYQSMEIFEKALPIYIREAAIRKKVNGIMHPAYARSLHSLATIHQQMSSFDKALPLYIKTISIKEKIFSKTHPSYARSLLSLAVLHQNMGDFQNAWLRILQTIESSSGIQLDTNINAKWCDTILQVPFSSNLHLEYTIKSIDKIFSLLNSDSSIQNIGQKKILLSDLSNALLTKLRNNITNEKDKLRILQKSNMVLQRSLKYLDSPQYNHKAFALIEQNKSVLLLQASKSEQNYRLGNLPDSLILVDKNLTKIQSLLQAKLAEKRSIKEKDSLRNELNHVNQNIDRFLDQVKKEYPQYHKLKYLQKNTQATDIQNHLDAKTALIEYLIGDSILHIFCLTQNQIQWQKISINSLELKNRVKKFHLLLSNYKALLQASTSSYQAYVEEAHWFYQKLIAPVLKDKQGLEHLVLVTDGDLGHLPFETFLVEEVKEKSISYNKLHYLLNDYNISYNYSATLWKENREAPIPKNNGQFLGVAANYSIQLDSAMINSRLQTDQALRSTLNPLPFAKKEVEELQKKYHGFFAFDELASEKTIKEKAGDFSILHFATHGILNPDKPILSSLAFTEDNDSIESNFWQAHEISKIKLNADLVVLSACETGFGKFEQGNGIASLARSFMYAGTSSLIVSLWQVNDQATSAIMQFFYQNLEKGLQKDKALRQAKIQYIQNTEGVISHPAFWSPFIQIGNTKSIAIPQKSNKTYWIIGSFLSLFIIFGFVLYKQKKDPA